MPRIRKYTKEMLAVVVASSHSVAEVIRKLGLKQGGGTQQHIKQRITEYALDTSHFLGQGWLRGATVETSPQLKALVERHRYTDEEVFCLRSPARGRELTKRLLRLGVAYCCSTCRLTTWRDCPIVLHLDHVNGEHSDNRRENLRFLCPNCHQQTPTWGNKRAQRA